MKRTACPSLSTSLHRLQPVPFLKKNRLSVSMGELLTPPWGQQLALPSVRVNAGNDLTVTPKGWVSFQVENWVKSKMELTPKGDLMEYLEQSENSIGYRVRIMQRKAFKITGYSIIVPPPPNDRSVPQFWDDIGADGRLEELKSLISPALGSGTRVVGS